MSLQNEWDQVAEKYWSTKLVRPTADGLKRDIWDPLAKDGFSPSSLAYLDDRNILDKFLWPTYSNETSSDQHVILIAIFFNAKGSLRLWSLFNHPDHFSSLFKRILSLNLDPSLPIQPRLALLIFIINAFQSLDNDFVRKECAPLVSIATWHNLHNDEARERQLDKSNSRRKAWRAAQKRYEVAAPDVQARIKFDRLWLYSMVLDFLNRLNAPTQEATGLVYCEKFLELLIDLLSQIPTRRYSRVLLNDMNLLPILSISKPYKNNDNALFRDLLSMLVHFDSFATDETDDQSASQSPSYDLHYNELARLQRTAYKHFEDKLRVLALSNYASIDQRSELEQHFTNLTDDEIKHLSTLLGFRTAYPANTTIPTGRSLWQETLVQAYSRPLNFLDVVTNLSISPKEDNLYDPKLLRIEAYDGSQPLAAPKLNLQYLSLSDFMWRSFELYQTEAFHSIRKDLEGFVRRMKPRATRDRDSTLFDGFTKMAMPIDKPAIVDIAPPKVGTTYPAFVRSEIILDVSRLTDSMRQEWDNLRPKDVVYLLCVKAPGQLNGALANGKSSESESGLLRLRTAEVVQVLDDSGRALRDITNSNGHGPRPRQRRLLLDLDPVSFQQDKDKLAKAKPDVYSTLNVIARRKGRENTFKPVLETIQKLVGSKAALPSWFTEVFLGYGDPKAATYPHLADRIEEVDFLDTFLDWEHLTESFPGRAIEMPPGQQDAIDPPYVLQPLNHIETEEPTNPKKRRRAQMEDDSRDSKGPIRVKTYTPKNTGPYPVDVPKKNTIRFTSNQVSAIMSGTQPGLSLIVGPPGTGKTDVATQIINLLYHNFPEERILLVAHSNQALNQLFQKIIALDIDPRHLLRLGHGEDELETEASYSKYGRVESFLDNRPLYLTEVNRLAASIGAEGAHGSSCETADYFNQVYIRPAWSHFWDLANDETADSQEVISSFPFHHYFSNAPIPELFPSTSTLTEIKEIASGCEHHITRIFSELASIRPFEILRHQRDQANHLLVNSARIIAMTSTHAAMRRSEIASLGFHFSTLIMEEAAQITEIESFIPITLQNPSPQRPSHPLKRIVLIGDHLQNSPVISSPALRTYSNFSQSLFLRLIRLNVPTTTLTAQGRCRPSIASLFSWRYTPSLTNLPHLLTHPSFQLANPGFLHTYQFINVPTYQSQDEREPTPHFIQNLGEAECAVALFQYMRLLGYPASSITILATYAGQQALIRDVLNHRCKANALFGLPRAVSTVDRYQGEQNDYIILSLTRTKNVGFLRDVRRITVMLSRARLGLYILGRGELWERCVELQPAWDLLVKRSMSLMVVPGEMFPETNRGVDDEGVQGTEMTGVEHLGQYVYEMTQAKIRAMGGNIVLDDSRSHQALADIELGGHGSSGGAIDDEADEEIAGDHVGSAAVDVEVEEDPLHEVM